MRLPGGNVGQPLPKGDSRWLRFLLLVLHGVVSAKGEYEDSCDFYAPSMYCNCDFFRYDEGMGLNCYVQGPLTPEDEVWKEMGSRNATDLSMVCKQGAELQFLPSAVLRDLSHLRTLRFRQARLRSVPGGSFSNNPLVDVDLSSNEIEKLERAAFADMQKLERISLTDNLLRKIEKGSFARLPKLRGLFLDGNGLLAIQSGSFQELSGLSELILSGNNLTRLEEGIFTGLSRLDFLDLFHNRIGELGENVFLPLISLIRLDLSRNRISSLHPNCFRGLKQLVVLQLDHNRLQTLPDRLFLPTSQLRQIGLDFNLLQTLPSYVLHDLERRTEEDFVFRFKDNPLRCDCGLWWVVTYHLNVSRSQSWKKHLRHVKCRSSDSAQGRGAQRVTKLTSDEFECGNDSSKYLNPMDSTQEGEESGQRDQDHLPVSLAPPARMETEKHRSNACFSTRFRPWLTVAAFLLAFLNRSLC